MSLFIPYHKRAPCKNHFPLKERRGREEGYWYKSHFIFDPKCAEFLNYLLEDVIIVSDTIKTSSIFITLVLFPVLVLFLFTFPDSLFSIHPIPSREWGVVTLLVSLRYKNQDKLWMYGATGLLRGTMDWRNSQIERRVVLVLLRVFSFKRSTVGVFAIPFRVLVKSAYGPKWPIRPERILISVALSD